MHHKLWDGWTEDVISASFSVVWAGSSHSSIQPSLLQLSVKHVKLKCSSYHVQRMWWSPERAEQLPGENSDPEKQTAL